MDFRKVLKFWFEETSPDMHFKKSDEFDREIEDRFLELHGEVAAGKHEDWKESADGTLAYIIVLDQFSRNMFRDNAMSYAYDTMSLKATLEGLEKGFDKEISEDRRSFFYMPLMHSEDRQIHETALVLFKSLGGESYEYEVKHKEIIDRFGRYPHRNEVLGRESTREEVEFLKTEGSSF